MSDHNTPDPVDRVYAGAEGLLDDDAARRARRSRVLEAVARDPAPQTAAPARARKSSGWRYVGWLTAASIAGLGGLIAYQLSPTAGLPPVALPGEVSSRPTPPSAASPPPAPDVQVEVQAPVQDRAAPGAQTRSVFAPEERLPEERPPEAAQNAAAPMAPPMPVAPPPVAAPEAAAAPPPPAAFPQERLESAEARRASAAPVAAPAPSARVQGAAATSSSTLGARLRAAAAAGRTSEVAELLADGAPVDARDNDGETALMKSIRANQPGIAALLRRRGADPDLENRAGVSARDMAQAADDPALERALRVER